MVGRFGVGYDRGLTMEAEVVCGRREMGFRSLKGEEHLLLGGERSCYVWAGF